MSLQCAPRIVHPAHTTTKESAMHVPSHVLRRIAVIALLTCAVLSGWSNAASARPLYDPTPHPTSAAGSSTSASSEGGDSTLPFMLAGTVMLVIVGAVGYKYRVRTHRRVTA
jgi:hypothetical protein